jgi:hypothetical protein
MMAATHVVKQGEHGSGIAEQYGFLKLSTVWNDDSNGDIRQKRETPDILLPGDEIQIPDKTAQTVTRPTTRVHVFAIQADKIRVRLRLRDLASKPVPNHVCDFSIEGQPSASTTDGDGVVDGPAPRGVKAAELKVDDKDFTVAVGRLDPIEETSGWQARLINLGYLEKPDPGAPSAAQIRDRELQSAIEEFQCDNGIPLSGVMDDATISALRDVHGC